MPMLMWMQPKRSKHLLSPSQVIFPLKRKERERTLRAKTHVESILTLPMSNILYGTDCEQVLHKSTEVCAYMSRAYCLHYFFFWDKACLIHLLLLKQQMYVSHAVTHMYIYNRNICYLWENMVLLNARNLTSSFEFSILHIPSCRGSCCFFIFLHFSNRMLIV